MEQYRYVAHNQKGERLEGNVEAVDTRQAVNVLHDRGLVVVKLTPKDRLNPLSFFFSSIHGVGIGELANFTRQLATMITAGLTLTDAIKILEKQTENEKLAKVLSGLGRDIQGGFTFAAGLSRHSDIFSDAYINMIKVGEASGTLDKVLTKLADTLEKQREFQGKVKSAFVYPIIVLVAMVAVTAIILIFVMPKLTDLYSQLGANLPISTKILISISKFMQFFWWLVLLAIIGIIMSLRKFKKTPEGAYLIDSFMFRLPVFGGLIRNTSFTEITRTLGALVASGVPIMESLRITSEVAPNSLHKDSLIRAISIVEKGTPLSVALTRDPLFPPIIPQMISVGEQTGKMDEVLEKISHYFESEAELQVKNLTVALEPIIMIVLGAMVGFLIFSIIMPIYQLTSSISAQ